MAGTDRSEAPMMRHAAVNLTNLQANLHRAGVDRVDITANAFGHGALEVARAAVAIGVRHFLVARSEELARLQPEITALGGDIALGSLPREERWDCYGLRGGEFEPVMTLSATVVATKSIRAGEGVSYGYTYRAPSDGWLALVPLGYGDGLLRGFGNRATAVSNGQHFRVAGRVAMDVHSLFTGVEPVNVGDEMTYFGTESISAADLAALVGVAPESIPATLGKRVIRTFVS